MHTRLPLKQLYYSIYHSISATLQNNIEAQSITYMIIEHYLHHGKASIVLDISVDITAQQIAEIASAIERIKNNEPIQYILGQAHFMSSEFIVNKNVLIPRQETEQLVQEIIKTHKHLPHLNILDIGTGTGCIAITLKKELNCQIDAIDSSSHALEVARKNAASLNAPINFIQKDILYQTLDSNTQYDIIVSNPPYVLESQKKHMNKNVIDYEPHNAIFVNDDAPLIFYKSIATIARNHLATNGYLYFEINELFGETLKHMLEAHSFTQVEIKKDLHDKDRYVICTNNHMHN